MSYHTVILQICFCKVFNISRRLITAVRWKFVYDITQVEKELLEFFQKVLMVWFGFMVYQPF